MSIYSFRVYLWGPNRRQNSPQMVRIKRHLHRCWQRASKGWVCGTQQHDQDWAAETQGRNGVSKTHEELRHREGLRGWESVQLLPETRFQNRGEQCKCPHSLFSRGFLWDSNRKQRGRLGMQPTGPAPNTEQGQRVELLQAHWDDPAHGLTNNNRITVLWTYIFSHIYIKTQSHLYKAELGLCSWYSALRSSPGHWCST